MLNFQAIIIKIPESIKWHNTKNRNISFEYPQKSLLKSSYPQKIIAKIKKIITVTWNSEYPPPLPTGVKSVRIRLWTGWGLRCHDGDGSENVNKSFD